MIALLVFLYSLFVLSLFLPFYTYALYPILLRILKRRRVNEKTIAPPLSIIIIGKEEKSKEKLSGVKDLEYPEYEVLQAESIHDGAKKAKHDILLFTDTETTLDKDAAKEIVKPFADSNVGCVVGQQTCKEGNSLFWKYENYVKALESRAGCVSGITDSIFAIRKGSIIKVPDNIRNESFYIATLLTRSGKAIVYEPKAKAFEFPKEGTNYKKHIQDAVDYWQAFFFLKMMLIPGKGSFVYISHRVMKWFVWLNMVIALITNGFLACGSPVMFYLFLCQVLFYVAMLFYSKCKLKWKLIGIAYYFFSLNISYMFGFFRYSFSHNKASA